MRHRAKEWSRHRTTDLKRGHGLCQEKNLNFRFCATVEFAKEFLLN